MKKINSIVIIQNELDERTLKWLISQVGEKKIYWAVGQLSGNTKPYISNIVKKLGLVVPSSIKKTPHKKARSNLKVILDLIDNKIDS